jgi:hypothetical protein
VQYIFSNKSTFASTQNTLARPKVLLAARGDEGLISLTIIGDSDLQAG